MASKSLGGTNVVLIPNRGKVNCNKLCEPPYNAREATICEPASSKVAIAKCNAACPLAVAKPPMPFSKAAMRSSNTAQVGLDNRE